MLQWLEHKYFEKYKEFELVQILATNGYEISLEELAAEQEISVEEVRDKLQDALAAVKVKSREVIPYISISGNMIIKSDLIRWEELQQEIAARINLKERELLREFHVGQLYTRKQIKQVLINMGTQESLQNLDGTFGAGIVNVPDLRLLLMLVNLKKDKAAEEANINYDDYITDHLHMKWESQNTTTLESEYGQIITEQVVNYEKLMFVRLKRKARYFDTYYFCLGRVHLEEYSGEEPIQVTWRFATPLNEFMYDYLRSARDEGDIASKIVVESNLFSQSLLDYLE